MSDIDAIRAEALSGVPHAFLGRRGGVSTGVYAGLNTGLGSNDDPAAVTENRRRATEAVLPGAILVSLHQVHSAIAVEAAPGPDAHRAQADALVTATPGLLLGILTADCVPVLLADKEAGVVGAAHAGWKGAIGGVIAATVEAMAKLGAAPARITAAIGPCIGRASYEVSDDFLVRFRADDPENERFFLTGRDGRHQFDIAAYVASRLALVGVGHVEALGLDTYAEPDRFYSYRRSVHRGEPDYGREIALIGLSQGFP